MKLIAVVSLCVTFLAQLCNAQMSVNADWQQRDGITVASSQRVKVAATTMRCFTTIQTIGAEPRAAIENLKSQKKLIADAVNAIGLPKNTLKFTPTKILEWEIEPKNHWYRSDSTGLSPKTDLENYTAVAHATFDISLDDANADDLTLKTYETCQKLRGHSVFESREIVVIFVGKLDTKQIKDAKKRAFDEAFSDAKTLASISGKALGKMAALTPSIDGRWMYSADLGYQSWSQQRNTLNPLSGFSPAENEVFGSNAFKLARTFSIELRYDIE